MKQSELLWSTVRAQLKSVDIGHTLRVKILPRGHERQRTGLMGLKLLSAATTSHPILNEQCAKQVDAAPWGLGSHPHPLSFHPHFSPPTSAVDIAPSVVCYLSLSLFLSLYPNIPHSLHPPTSLALFVGGERESCWLPEADCSSLNNSSSLPVALSPVLHHSITPFHKDVQMGQDAHS